MSADPITRNRSGFKGPWQPKLDAQVYHRHPAHRKLVLADELRLDSELNNHSFFRRLRSPLKGGRQRLGSMFQRLFTCNKSIVLPSVIEEDEAAMPMLQEENFSGKKYSWMFVFTLPSAVTPQQQAQFEQLLERSHSTAEDVLVNAFKEFVDEHAIQKAMRVSVYRGSLSQALQCTIELILTWFENFNASVEDALRQMEPSDPTPPSSNQASLSNKINSTKNTLRASRACSSFSDSNLQQSQTHANRWSLSKTRAKHKDLLLICARQSLDLAEYFADVTQYPVQLSRQGISKLGITISDDVDISPAYVNYNMEFRNLCRLHRDRFDCESYTVLKYIDRLLILYDQLTNYLDVQSLLRMGLIADSFPLHHRAYLREFQKTWGSFWLLLSFSQPIEDIRDYFGAEIGFYFFFLHELSLAMLILAIPTLAVVLLVYIGDAEPARNLVYFIVLIWYRLFTKHWIRKEREYTVLCGYDAYDSSTVKELRNIRFIGKPKPSPENEDVLMPRVSWLLKGCGRVLSNVLTFLFVLVLIAVVALEYYIYVQLRDHFSSEFSSTIISSSFGSLCGLQIKIVDRLWDTAADWITDLECRMLQMHFENSKRQKTSVVKFVTSIGSLVCAALVPGYGLRGSKDHEAWARYQSDLRVTLISTFVTRYVLLYGTVANVVTPYLKIKLKRFTEGESEKDSYKESQLNMLTYGAEQLSDDYLNVLTPLGIVLFFGVIEPLLIFLMLLTLLIRLRADAWKLLNVYRRPFPRVATNIGIFNSMLQGFAYLMIITNTLSVFQGFGGPAYTEVRSLQMVSSPEDVWLVDIAAFLSLTFANCLFWHVMGAVIPEETYRCKTEMRRHKLQRHHFLYNSVCESINVRQVSFDAFKLAGRENFDMV